MTTELNYQLALNTRARALLAGAESMTPGPHAAAARRRYWRDLAASYALIGLSWPEAEQLGIES